MSLTGASLNRFRARVDAVLDDAFPVTLIIASLTVTASSPGGKTLTDYINGGETTNFRIPFRIPISSLAAAPQVGDSLNWQLADATLIPLEITEIAIRPHESRYSIVCKSRRV